MAEAKEYLKRRRNVKPGVYNSNRLKEKPIPPFNSVNSCSNRRKKIINRRNRPEIVRSCLSNSGGSEQQPTEIPSVNNLPTSDEWRSDTPPLTPETHISDSESDEEFSEIAEKVSCRIFYVLLRLISTFVPLNLSMFHPNDDAN